MNKIICLCVGLFFLVLFTLKCLTDSENKIETNNPPVTIQDSTVDEKKDEKKDERKDEKKDELYESFRQIGWIKEDRYRVLVYIITKDECINSPISDIEAKIKLAAFNSLQNELNSAANRNASVQIKNLIDNFGMTIQVDKNCSGQNIFFYDIKKKNLKSDFEKIRNIK